MAPPWFGERLISGIHPRWRMVLFGSTVLWKRLISGTPPQNKGYLSAKYLTDICPSPLQYRFGILPAITGSTGDSLTQGVIPTSGHDRGAGNFLYPCRKFRSTHLGVSVFRKVVSAFRRCGSDAHLKFQEEQSTLRQR